MDDFNKRLRAAMLAAGIEDAAGLAKRCGETQQAVEAWLVLSDATLPGTGLLKLGACLHTRMQWLADGTGPVRLPPGFEQAIEILDRLPQKDARRFLVYGWRLARRAAP